MSTDAATRLVTADELAEISSAGQRCELIRGEVVYMSPAGGAHGFIALRIGRWIGNFVDQHDLGAAFGSETGFLIGRNPDTVRAPDVAFMRKQRVQVVGVPAAFVPEAPALAVEVVSPDDSAKEVDAKARMWIASGAEEVWVLFPSRRTLSVYDKLGGVRVLSENDTLLGGELLPGFELPIANIFAGLS